MYLSLSFVCLGHDVLLSESQQCVRSIPSSTATNSLLADAILPLAFLHAHVGFVDASGNPTGIGLRGAEPLHAALEPTHD